MIKPAIPQVAASAKASGIYPQHSALDAMALALTVMTVPFVAILATTASVYGLVSALDAKRPEKRPALALTVLHVAI